MIATPNRFTSCIYLLLALLLLNGCTSLSHKTGGDTSTFNVEEITIAAIHEAFRQGNCTCEQLVMTYLQRI